MSKKLHFCSICHETPVAAPHAVLPGYICEYCERRKDYTTPNYRSVGKPCKWPSFAVEFEVAAEWGSSQESRDALALLLLGFERTSDRTVDDEYKSPIYYNLRAFRKPLAVFHDLRELVTDQCGTHLHVTFQHNRALREMRHAVFGPLIAYLEDHEEQTIGFWGRSFCAQASATLTERERHVSFNLWSSHPTIEYRLPRFRSAQQYLAVVQFCRSTTRLLETYFDADAEKSRLKPLPPEMIGDRILARYQKAVGTFEQSILQERNVYV